MTEPLGQQSLRLCMPGIVRGAERARVDDPAHARGDRGGHNGSVLRHPDRRIVHRTRDEDEAVDAGEGVHQGSSIGVVAEPGCHASGPEGVRGGGGANEHAKPLARDSRGEGGDDRAAEAPGGTGDEDGFHVCS